MILILLCHSHVHYASSAAGHTVYTYMSTIGKLAAQFLEVTASCTPIAQMISLSVQAAAGA